MTDNDLLIYHLYADEGVESDYLSRFGTVVRVGLDPVDRNDSHPIAGDCSNIPLSPRADLVVAHPECGPWNQMNVFHGNADEQPRQIQDAREACKHLGEHYIIENVPSAPLEDPIILEGAYFGLPITKRRAFETSFSVPQPEIKQRLTDHCNNWDRYGRSRRWWESVMGVENWYPIDPLVNAGMPRAYIEYLLQWYFEAIHDTAAVSSSTQEVVL
jgi:hypothetical protein